MTVDRHCVKVVHMNEQQQRALWSAAFHTLADAIDHNLAPMPTSVDLWTQYVTPVQLLEYADRSTPEPLEIRQMSNFASIKIPTVEPLDLQISWTLQAETPDDAHERAIADGGYQLHNAHCVPAAGVAPDSETIWNNAGVGIDVTLDGTMISTARRMPDGNTHISTEHIERDPTDG